MMIMYKPKKEFVKESPNTNVVISLYTNASARLKLLEAMEKVHESPRLRKMNEKFKICNKKIDIYKN